MQAGIKETGFSGHIFHKEAAQYIADQGMLDESIQRLGRWTSNAFKLYYKSSPATLYHLNLSFQKGIPLAVPRVTVLISKKLASGLPKPQGDGLPINQTSITHNPSLGTSLFFGQLRAPRPGESHPESPACQAAPPRERLRSNVVPLQLGHVPQRPAYSTSQITWLDCFAVSLLLHVQFFQKCNKILNH